MDTLNMCESPIFFIIIIQDSHFKQISTEAASRFH